MQTTEVSRESSGSRSERGCEDRKAHAVGWHTLDSGVKSETLAWTPGGDRSPRGEGRGRGRGGAG